MLCRRKDGAKDYCWLSAISTIDGSKTYGNDDSGVGGNLGRNRNVHLYAARVSSETGDLLESSKSRAGRSQQAKCSGESFHVDAEPYCPLIRHENVAGCGDIFSGVLDRLLYRATPSFALHSQEQPTEAAGAPNKHPGSWHDLNSEYRMKTFSENEMKETDRNALSPVQRAV
jgi:hypothetical protein